MIRSVLARTISRALAIVAGACAFAAAGCSEPTVSSAIEGEPVCADFKVGPAKMRGGLRLPILVTLKEDGETITKVRVFGLRNAGDPATRFPILDANRTYDVEWSLCGNERAPRPVSGGRESKEAIEYECGQSEPYATEKLTTKKGDAKSRVLAFKAPAKVACWVEEGAELAAANAADAGTVAAAVDAGPSDGGDLPDAGDVADAAPLDAGLDAAPAATSGPTAAPSASAAPADAPPPKKKKPPAAPPPAAPPPAAPPPAAPPSE